MSTRYRLTITIILAALLTGGNAQATGVVVKGSVFGGGNEARVYINTSVTISAGAVEGNVYGGGNLGDVGTHADLESPSVGNYSWKDQDGNTIDANTADNKMTGVSNVTITGGTIGLVSTNNPKEHGNVFGGGKGSATTFECEKGMVYNTNVSINTSASVKGNVYGGGEVSRVENNTEVTIGTASESSETHAIIEGSVFGAGAGINTHGYSALVRGTSTVTVQGSAQVKKNVYGGGELASVGRYNIRKPGDEEHTQVAVGMPYELVNGGTNTVTIQGKAVIGTDDDATTGHVYGAGQGLNPYLVTYTYTDDEHKPKRMVTGNDWQYFADVTAYLQFVETLALSAETDVTVTGEAIVKGSVFGGSENGFVYHDTDVEIQGGTVNCDVFGGGRGLVSYSEAGRVRGKTVVAVSDGDVYGNVYGGGNLGDVGYITKDFSTYNYTWKQTDGTTDNVANYNTNSTNTNTGICTVTISGGTIGVDNPVDATKQGNVFGAGKGLKDTWWCEKAISFATNVSISAGTVKGNVYGGGQLGRVEDDTKVTIGEGANAPVITGNVFGAGAGTHTHGYSALVRGNADVTVQGGAQIGGSVYGGGEIASVGRFNVVGGLPKDPLSGGTCKVTIDDDAVITGDVFGACKGVNPSLIAQDDRKSMQLLTNAPENTDLWSHYNNDENSPFIWRTYATDADYLAFLETLALTSNTEVTISGNATVNESVYGGGQRGITLGSVTVNMTGGTVEKDIYGGGALANTNKGNWNFTLSSVSGLTTGTSIVTGYYTRSGEGTPGDPYVYTEITAANALAEENTTYYSSNTWANVALKSALYTTKVVLTGGTAKNVYGGALGDVDNQAKVYGDIAVYLNGIEDADYNSTDHASLSAAIGSDHMLPQDATGAVVDKIFGANNLYGTPLGHVKVHVFATQTAGANKKIAEADKYSLFEDISNYTITDYTDLTTLATAVGADVDTYTDILTDDNATTLQKEAALADMIDAIAKKKYDVQAVYGGGNLSAYEPIESNERTEVIIDGCHYTSIRQVYGGGNAASVPASYVRVNGTYEIHEVFGGGNGNDPYVLDNKYYNNPGANVGYYNYTHWDDQTGADLAHAYNPIDNTTPDYPDATTKEARMANYRYGSGIATSEIYGGLIHSVYGGSNQKGNISTTAISIYDDMDDNCPVTVDETYGGGKNAPMDGEIELSLDCVKNMPMIFGGAKNADVNSDVTLNITNGTFQKVFGGNNMGGAINGSITVNIKEEGCQPIIIGELYGGGYFADYSVYGYNADKTIKHDDGVDDDQDIPLYKDPRINVISASKIGAIYGGGYKAVVVGNPHINVNMEAGIVKNVASNYESGQDYTVSEVVEITKNESTTYNAILAIGSIGDIYGGGNLANIEGDTHVEIGTGTWHNANGELETISPARNAANITGDVFGGGQGDSNPVTAMVTGNTNINFGNGSIAKSVYGGGKLAQVGGDAIVTVSGGTIGTNNLGGAEYGNIYGGGFGSTDGVLFGLIKGNTYVNISDGTILHNIYGGGAYGSVGTYTYDNNNVITGHTANTGTANIWITGGTIGTDGKENGMVFGSSRGDVGEPDGIHDRLAWVYDTKVIIGDTTANATITTTTPLIKGSIYGGGENGHNYNDAYVRINGGTIGINNNEDVTYHDDPTDNTLVTYSGKDYNYPYRGNVYGGGCGTDQYDSDDDNINDSYNPKAGIVLNNARVNITGGHIIRNVYGAGAMGSVGTITNDINEKDANDKYIYRHDQTKTESYIYPYSGTYQGAFYNFGLSWPVELVYPTTSGQDAHTYTGKTTVTITGSTTTIGVSNSDATGGDVYGAARGEAGDRFEMAGFANVREASVTIGTIGQDGPDIKGSVFGGSANGHVYEDASVVINSGTIAHSVFGGGNGDGTYKSTLWKPKSSDPDDITLHDETEIQDIYSFNAGKVYGNTNVTINGGTVKRNVYGGGNLGSVGKGNYSGGTDDYSTVGYGELPAKDNDQETALWTNSLFTNSGLATVIINSGTIGESGVDYDDDGLPTGNVFGSSRGKAALNVGQRSPRYKYVPDFFLGYTNETAVIIGSDDENYSGTNPIIYGSVYGGGQDGHVRRGTNVTVNKGTIGMASEGGLDRGNVFGAGSGIGTYTDVYDNDIPKCSNSSGSVTGTTTVDIKGGTIYQNVYGGGALASVGPPWAGQGAPSNNYDERKVATGTSASYSYTQVNIGGGNISGSVYGASRGPSQSLIDDVFTVNSINTYDAKSFATVIWADVNVTGDAVIAGSVFGGGEKGIVKHATEVNIGTTGNNGTAYTGTISQNVYGGGKEAIVGGNVTVNINSGTITQNVFGGGDQANTNTNSVKIKNSKNEDVNETGAYNTADEPANGVSTIVNMTGATAATVYGGGNLADVIGNVTVNIEDGTLNGTSIGSETGAVFGGGFGETTKVTGNVEVNIGTRTTSGEPATVTYGGDAQITGDVYGGSAKGKVNTSNGTNATENTTTSVNLYGGSITGSLYGGGLGDNTPDAEISANVYGPVTVTVEGGSATNVYGCNNLYGAPQSTVAVNINGTATPTSPATYAIGNVYGGGNLAEYGGSPIVSMSDGYVNNIFGGGNQADVAGSVTVTVSGGNVINDVYGGGALANTNTANWDFTNETWAGGIIDETTGATTYNTTVNLTGGIIGNAYGGALGRLAQDAISAIPAMVYGDVTVTVNGAALPAVLDRVELDADNKPINILKGGRVFGCNNINGTPKGKVQVIVSQTSNSNTAKQDKPLSRTTITDRYHYYYDDGDQIDVAAVYGGGNASDYEPVTNQAPKVIIDGCNDVSIGSVYGGGNAAAVPATDVVIEGSYYIGYVFGGGFGAGSDNRGANVGYKSFPLDNPPTGNDRTPYLYGSGQEIGNALVTVKGGYIDNVFGGSDTKGDISGTVASNISEVSNGCDLKIGSLYGGGRRATVDHDITTQIDCPSNSISAVYGGSEMADIHGNVTLTITAGTFDEVFGGNRKSGVIDGYITVNLEETSIGCRPIRITSLYGGCDDAPYSGAANSDGYNVTVNAKAFTSIGSLFGGSKGANAILTGNTLVNVNQTLGYWAGKHYPLQVPGEGGQNVDNTNPADLIPNQLGTIGTIYGGGDQAKVDGNTIVNIGTETTVGFINEPTHLREDPEVPLTKSETDNLYYVPVLGANITGDVYGGGNLANVTGNTYVNIGANKETEEWQSVPVGSEGLTIGGNVYGGGKGAADNFECDKAMVGTEGNYGENNTGSTYVHIGNGTIGNGTTGGNVYGGGMVGRVEANTNVTVGFGNREAPGETPTSAPVIYGSLYGAGQGVATHGYSGLVRGNSTVTIMGNTKLMGSVYGGGQKATVGRFWVKDINNSAPNAPTAPTDTPSEMPYAPMAGGTCTVTIGGYAEIGPDDMVMNNTSTGKPDDLGHVFGAGKGLIPYEDTDTEPGTEIGQGPGRWYKPDGVDTWQSYANNESEYLVFIETFALASNTYVTIRDNAFIKGSVYGGSENGRVLNNTSVTIQDNCQIGNGYVQMNDNGNYLANPLAMNRRYSDEEWSTGHLITTTNDRQELRSLVENNNYYTNSLPECNSWPYGEDTDNDGINDTFAPHDRFATFKNDGDGKYYYDERYEKYAEGGKSVASDGHTFYGNVFGGGSGYFPYKNDDGEIKWHWEAGAVGGNTTVTITGGHILTNIYGGNEMTNVGKGVTDTNGGKCTIEFGGTATLGVPRTLGQIASHPVTCYLFGAGKGDQRVFFNKQTNVNDAVITITGGIIYGSVFGGGEDGHVMRDVKMTIGNTDGTGPTIGTWGTSYVDGNVFGGGRGFAGDAYTAGNVGGSIDLKIKGGTMLGSIYGGGRLGSVGYGLYGANENGYGEMRDDNTYDDGTEATNFKRGYVDIEISGGTIGNDYECIIPQEGNMPTGLSISNIESWSSENWTTWKNHNHVPYTEYELYVDDDYRVYRLSHAKGGNVFAGGMGRNTLLNGEPITSVNWKKLGNVKSTKLTITGGTIKSNVYGGGEFGAVLGDHSVTHGMSTVTGTPTINAGTEIRISGSSTQIGTSYIDESPDSGIKYDDSYYFGSIYGGGKGSIDGGGDISVNTFVEVTDGKIMQNIYGGGQLGSVGTIISESEEVHSETETDMSSDLRYAYYNFGLSWPLKLEYKSGTGNTYILIKGGKIGISGSENGDVFGGCKGLVLTSNNKNNDEREAARIKEARIGNVNNTFVEIDYTGVSDAATASDYEIIKVWEGKEKPKLRMPENKKGIAGSAYGGAEDGHVYNDTKLTLKNGLVGHALYGGGKGKGTYKGYLYDASKFTNQNPTQHEWKDAEEEEIHSINAGRVYGNTNVVMEGGYVMRSIYGGGNLGSVGIGNYSGGSDDYSNTGYGEMPPNGGSLWTNTYFTGSGKTSVTVKAGQIGYLPDFTKQPEGIDEKAFKKLFNKDDLPTGNVFGGSRGITSPNGSMSPRYLYFPDFFMGYANESEVIIGTTDGSSPIIYGSVYGGGQDGHIRRDAKVTINDAVIGIDYSNAQTILHENDIKGIALMARGNVYGAGSGIGKFGDGDKDYNYSSGSVTCATEVEINGGTIYQNVYGGGALASIGPPNTSLLTPDPTDDKDDESDKAETGKLSYSYTKVSVNGGQIGNSAGYSAGYGGNVFAASRGNEDLHLDTTMFATDLWSKLLITDGTIYGSAYGGGEFGIVKCGVDVNILGGTIMHDVYGGGAIANTNTSNWGKYVKYSDIMGTELQSGESVTGLYTYNSTTHQYTQITENATAAANTEYFDQTWVDGKLTTEGGKYKTQYNTKVNLLGGTIHGDVYGGALGRFEDAENNISEINAYVYGDVTVNLNGMEKADHDANTSLFGFLTPTDDNYMVPTSITEDENIIPYSGAIVNRIFGGNNLKGTPKGHIKVHVFATQNSTLTTSVAASSKYAKHPVQGEKLQNIDNSNETYANYLTRLETTYDGVSQVTSAITSVRSASETLSNASTAYDNADDNNKPEALESLNNAQAAYDNAVSALKNVLNNLYDVEAVYGGGNLAAYIYGNGEKIANTDANKTKIEAARTEVIIDGCDFTSIRQVYAGGNAASAPGTFVEINGSYEIDEAFGGGNGADPYVLNNKYYNNPGANVGYYNYTHWDDQTGVDLENAYNPIDNTDASTPEKRRAIYGYGSGIATTDIRGGTIHYVFGGSNKKGNISTTALSVYTESFDDCPIIIHETYGGGKDAPIDGEIELTLDCVKDMDMIFGGSKNADVNNNITLNITNGKFKKVFGGNNTSGAINGSITVNIEEKGCVPIDIDELYGGGYLAPYSIYGYSKTNGNYDTELVSYIDDDNVERSLYQRIPLTEGDNPKNDPRINIISATRIGSVYGGGYQAKVVGSPYVNVNMTNGIVDVKNTAEPGNPAVYKDGGGTTYTSVAEKTIEVTKVEKGTDDPDTYAFTEGEQPNLVTYVYKDAEGTIYNPAKVVTENNRLYAGIGEFYATLNIGTIDSIYGGGNLADIVGNTHVEIGTGRWVTSWDANGNPIYETMDVNNVKYIYKVATPAVTYTTAECTANNAALDTISTSTVLTQKQATRINELLSLSGNDTITKGQNPTQAQVYAYNATIDGYLTTADIKAPAIWKWYDANGTELADQTQPTPIRYAATITGDVFGGGKGKADNFTCDKAMIGINDEAADPSKRNGGTNVIIANGTVGGSVYGGGMIARVEKNTSVTIGFESGIGEPVIQGDVFGAGMGVDTHGYAGLVRGNSSVTIQGNSKVRGSVYGGGKQASIGRYFVAITQDLADAHDVDPGMPYDLKSGGKATVIVRGNAEIGPDNMMMTASGGPDNTGHVFGAGKGTIPYKTNNPGRYYMDGTTYTWQSYSEANESAYLKYIETLGITNETEVLIGGNAFIKGSVYGGSESGFVRENTHVTIQDNCQIGNSYIQMADDGTYLNAPAGLNRRITDKEWEEGHLFVAGDPSFPLTTPEDPEEAAEIADAAERTLRATYAGYYQTSLPECNSWPYQAPYAPYDKFADADGNYPEGSAEPNARGGLPTGSDGHTFYGNVFGGGSGYYPYKPGTWHRLAGAVGGNTVVDITGGHILTSVYGGNEHTDVGTYKENSDHELIDPVSGGKATINMVGGTLGVPRTLGQIAAHPVTCYLFGAGKGDMRTFFNTWTNVTTAEVNITGNARIYGSVFGGGEDGHVLSDVELNIGNNITIGNTNYTPGDGLIIGTTGTSYVDGNVFGAGRGFNGEALTAGSVGGNVVTNIKGGTMLGSVYGGGRLASVGIGFNAATDANYGSFTPDTDNNTHGHVTVNISGGTIGNDLEDITVEHPKGGNVFGGSMGRLTLLDDSYNKLWPQLAQVKTATVNISGNNTIIKGSVYGGSELGTVRDSTNIVVGKASLTSETITRPTIYRNIFGGGYGSIIRSDESKATIESKDANNNTILFGYTPMQWSGLVGINTRVNIYNGWIKKCIYGGGEMASVGIINYILDDTQYNTENDVPAGKLIFRIDPETNKYVVYKNIVKHVDEEKSFALSWPYQLEYFPGYEGNSYVNIYGGRIGITGKDFMGPFNADGNPLDSNGNVLSEDKDNKADAKKIKDARLDNGDVFGGGKGFASDRYEYAFCANVQNTHVTINYDNNSSATPETYKNKSGGNKISNYTYANDCVSGAVYGGGENGHVMGNTEVNLINGLVGHAIYGGGNGKGQFTKTLYLIGSTTQTHPVDIYSITAGKVYGNTKVNMKGGYVVRNIYGGGNMGSVGKGTYAGGTDDYSYYDFLPIRLFNGYGEAIDDLLWTPSENFDPTLPIGSDNQPITMADYFLSSGKTEVTITGGQIGFVDEKPDDSMKDGLPYGNVFGGCRGESAPNIQEIPRYDYSPECYSGYVNETKVTIGNDQGGPIIYGSVYGGGQDGHVRRDTKVTINNATIGLPYNTDNRQLLGTLTLSGENEPTEQDNALISSHNDVNDAQWLFRGNVFGAGSGIGQYKYDFNANNRNTVDTDHDEVEDDDETEIEEWNYHNPITGEETLMKEVDYSTSAGSVTRFTNVEINGGTIYRNVYGGGSQASVGPPKIPIRTDDDPYRKGDTQSGHGVGKQTLNEVIINGGTIGDTNSRTDGYGGNVYGASRGNAELIGLGFSTSVWTNVEANSGHIYGNIFGGGEAGSVTRDTKVIIGGPNSGSGAPRRAAPAVQPNAAAPAVNTNSGNSDTRTPANVATEAPDARSIRVNRANQ